METNGYWGSIARKRITRRTALAGTGMSAAVVALSLAGCGSGSSGSGSKGQNESAAGKLYRPVDTTSSAKAGGVFKDFQASDVQHFDALASNAAGTVNNGSVFAYPTL